MDELRPVAQMVHYIQNCTDLSFIPVCCNSSELRFERKRGGAEPSTGANFMGT